MKNKILNSSSKYGIFCKMESSGQLSGAKALRSVTGGCMLSVSEGVIIRLG